MHTTRVIDDNGRHWFFIHNGDWSGEVFLRRIEEDPGGDESKDKVVEDYTLPGSIIRKACASGVVGNMIAMLEQWDGSDDAACAAGDTLLKRPEK